MEKLENSFYESFRTMKKQFLLSWLHHKNFQQELMQET